MIYRRYGQNYQSVDVDFDAKALNEFGFRRNRTDSFPTDELESRYRHIETVELTAEAEGSVQTETQQQMLDRVRQQLEQVVASLPEGGIVIVENESGHDYPKPRQEIKNVVEEGENRLHFVYTMAPNARVASYAPAG